MVYYKQYSIWIYKIKCTSKNVLYNLQTGRINRFFMFLRTFWRFDFTLFSLYIAYLLWHTDPFINWQRLLLVLTFIFCHVNIICHQIIVFFVVVCRRRYCERQKNIFYSFTFWVWRYRITCWLIIRLQLTWLFFISIWHMFWKWRLIYKNMIQLLNLEYT